MRRFLLYCPVHKHQAFANLFGPDRLYDVALNSYSLDANRSYHPQWVSLQDYAKQRNIPMYQFTPGQAEYEFAEDTYPSWAAHRNMAKLPPYEFYCFADDDVQVTTTQLNALFTLGAALRLQLYQPSLSARGFCYHRHLRQRAGSYVRTTSFVESMIPIFSQSAWRICQDTLLHSRSGFGLDSVWPRLLNYERMAVIDGIAVVHARTGTTGAMRFDTPPYTPDGEAKSLQRRYGIRGRVPIG